MGRRAGSAFGTTSAPRSRGALRRTSPWRLRPVSPRRRHACRVCRPGRSPLCLPPEPSWNGCG